MSNKHVMLDLETWGNGPDAAIAAIGACLFDRIEGVGATFYRNIDLESAVQTGGTITPSTVKWWMQQPEPARKALTEQPLASMAAALQEFAAWLGQQPFAALWGNGAAFDNVILRTAYRRCNIAAPWDYRQDFCYRTMRSLYPGVPHPQFQTELVAHRADHDAIWQASQLLLIDKIIGVL